MSQKTKEYQKDEDEDSFDAGFDIPQTKSALNSLQQALWDAHQEENEEDKKQGKPKKQKRGGVICVCGNPSCGIGGFVERQGQYV